MLGLRRLNERLLPGHMVLGPRHVILGVNNYCNLHCRMCDVGTGHDGTNFGANLVGAKTANMPMALLRRIVDQVAASWPRTQLAFVYTEPLAWPPLGEALAYARARKLLTSVTTNGLLLPRRAKEVSAANVLAVSLDGPEAVHDGIRRHKGSFTRAVQGIEAVAAMPSPPEISVYCTITQWNSGSLREFLAQMRHLPLKRIGLIHNNFVTAEQAEQHNLLHGAVLPATPSNVFEADPAAIDLDVLSQELTEIAASRYPFPVKIQPGITTRAALETYYRYPQVKIGRYCHDAFRSLMIDADGEVIPVHGRCFRFPIANIRDQPLEQLWNHPAISGLRQTLAQAGGLLPACSRCCGGFGGADQARL